MQLSEALHLVPGDPYHEEHFLAVHIVLTVVKCHRKELMTVINIYHRQSALYCDGRGDEVMSFDFTHRP
jgi:hypothetical protein